MVMSREQALLMDKPRISQYKGYPMHANIRLQHLLRYIFRPIWTHRDTVQYTLT